MYDQLLNTMRILIIEDNHNTASYLQKGLIQHGFIVDTADNGQDGLHWALEVDYAAIILDIMLPQLDGWSVIAKIRHTKPNLPVLFLTAKDELADKVKGFELGADDYLVKPFAFSELLLRIRSLLRRGQSRQDDQIQVADLKIDLIKRKAVRGDHDFQLTTQEFNLLALLAQRANEVLSRTIIAEQIWDINFDCDTNIIDAAIRRLRRKMDDPFEKKLIYSVRGIGYVLKS